MAGYLKVVDDRLLYDGAKLELLVPDEYFKSDLCVMNGTQYSLFGYLTAYHYDNKTDDRKKAIRSTMVEPITFITKPTEVTKEKLSINNKPEELYHIFTYYKDDVVFNSATVIQNTNNVLIFYEMLQNGQLDMVEYKNIPKMLQKCKLLNACNFGLPGMYEEVVIADYYRNPENLHELARFAANKFQGKHFYAKGITQREKVSQISTFSAIMYEDITSMLTKADNNKRENKQERMSETERISLSRS